MDIPPFPKKGDIEIAKNYRGITLTSIAVKINNIPLRNGFKLANERSRRYPAQTFTDADYADDIALLANTPAQAETLLHRLERAAGGISLHVNAD